MSSALVRPVPLLLLLWLCAAAPRGAVAQCPAGCTCTGLLVRCRGLSQLPPPAGFPRYATYLDLSFSRLEEIPANSFRGLTSLYLLNLQDNDIRSISPSAFTDLSRLERLNLRRNKLEVIESYTFQPLTFLRTLYLSDNGISALQPHAFSGLSRLETLLLDRNDLNTVTKENVKPLSSLRTLDMQGAGLHCDCKLAWMKSYSAIDVSALRCQTPDSLSGRILETVSFNELNCSAATALAVRPLVQSYHGEDALLECTLAGEPQPEVLTWSFNNNSEITNSQDYQLPSNGSLVVRGVVLSLAGVYTCTARNVMGSGSAHITLQYAGSRVPGFLERPVDTHAFEGESLLLLCAVDDIITGSHWERNDQQLQLSNRVSVLEGGALQVLDAMATDSGRYTCVATNAEGAEFRASAEVSVTGPLLSCSGLLRREDITDIQSRVALAFSLTQQELSNGSAHSPFSLLRRLNFPQNGSIELFKAAEVYAELLAMVRSRQHEQDSIDIPQLTECEATVLAELSGCREHEREVECPQTCGGEREWRSADGSCNSLNRPLQGSAGRPLKRLLDPAYEDGLGLPVGWSGGLPSARHISSTLLSVKEPEADDSRTHMLMQFGQFLDHDLDMTPVAPSDIAFDSTSLMSCDQLCTNQAPCFPIPVAPDDARISRPCLPFTRSSAVCGTGAHSVLLGETPSPVTRQQINAITSYIDLSQVYGSSETMATQLRDPESPAHLLRGETNEGGKPLLPFDHHSLIECATGIHSNRSQCFLAGDARANEQVGLTAMHTLFFREHNRLVDGLAVLNPHWQAERLYQEARSINIAQWQHIVTHEYLPAILGASLYRERFSSYPGYDAREDPTIANAFATAAYRFGHSQIMPVLHRLDHDYQEHSTGPLLLQDAFFAPFRLLEEGGVDPLVRGLVARPLKLRSPHTGINSNLTEALFQQANEVALDLAALNIQRGRDHGLPSYNQWREFCGGVSAASIEDLRDDITNSTLRSRLRSIYGDAPGDVDLWVGGLLEEVVGGGQVGPTFSCIIADQFHRLSTGDRFWHEREGQLTPDQHSQVKMASLSRIICDNADNITRVPQHAFQLEPTSHFLSCDLLPRVSLQPWADCGDEPLERGQRSVLMGGVYQQLEQRLVELEAKAGRCRFNDADYESGAQWEADQCMTCHCQVGGVRCLKMC